MLIHKFTKFNFAESIVQTGCIKFTYPKFFNDPFDCSIALIEEYLTFDEIQSTEQLNYAIDFFYKQNPNLKPQKQIHPLQEIEEIKQIANTVALLQKAKTHFTSVCSFSTEIEHILLWGHYADGHKGIALSFEINEPNFLPNIEEWKIVMDKVLYGFSADKLNYFEHPQESYKRIFLTKSKDWEYEQEYRILLADDDGLIQYKKSALKEITFGNKVNEDLKKGFITMCSRKGFSNLKFNHVIQDGLELKVKPLPDDFAKSPFTLS